MRITLNLPIASCIAGLAFFTGCSKQLAPESTGKKPGISQKIKATGFEVDDNPAWVEDFNQKDGFDTTIWSKIPAGKSDWDKHMSDNNACYAMRDGKLVLRGIVNPNTSIDSRPYLTGGVQSKDKKDFGLGRIEIRAKFSSARGAWPALWMLSSTGNYPEGGEIDIMEHLNYDKLVYQTIHTKYTLANGNPNVPQRFAQVPIAEGFNTYAIEKHQDSIVFFVNNKRSFAYPRTTTNQFPFADVNHYLLLDMQLGGSWVGHVDPTTLPVEMEIDWVKFYPLRKVSGL
ncbi:beta-glucanase [Chryseobacterium lactis]|uniref:Beta-glucanase n=1 Tax=Chryseobacterium lactis TaxID=1241981 RepID=A0A3G6RIT2_CHRLC|nr:glycoside hydrolase family 16 protein [Chryseobacterium lactis]AZA84337.1 glycoside hydrolase family 16 protein [Chryseobacterium lactis]AZB04725.1 glycoside hydrolase family 16 protein [Chryseobacterium lactis]PNW14456.1 beta-glucanase [Chryseobacterium lactis]